MQTLIEHIESPNPQTIEDLLKQFIERSERLKAAVLTRCRGNLKDCDMWAKTKKLLELCEIVSLNPRLSNYFPTNNPNFPKELLDLYSDSVKLIELLFNRDINDLQ